MDNKQNYRTLDPWEEITLKHVSAIIGEIIGAGCSYSILVERISDMMLELSYWDTPDNLDEEVNPNSNCSNQELLTFPKYIEYGASGEDGDKELNPAWEYDDIAY